MAWSPIEKGASIGPLYKRSRRRRTDGRTNSRAINQVSKVEHRDLTTPKEEKTRLGICYSRFVLIRVQICVFLPTEGGKSAKFHPYSRKP